MMNGMCIIFLYLHRFLMSVFIFKHSVGGKKYEAWVVTIFGRFPKAASVMNAAEVHFAFCLAGHSSSLSGKESKMTRTRQKEKKPSQP